ncbi:MAG: hypothetical protein KTU85_08950 [Acidimicrobiia bacterium]|nr:hypothetical protein [Acidimicrobiia bacterium]MCY4457413.1 hypothetical protein [Acidimicrobiaceae bacterium]
MSIELILAIVGVVAAVAIPVWQLRYGEQRKRSLPKKIEVAYFALTALVADQNKSCTDHSGMTDEELRTRIIERCNESTNDGNFDTDTKNKTLHSYINNSINELSNPKSETLGPLIEVQDNHHKVTELGSKVHQKLSPDPSEAGPILSEFLNGSRDFNESKSSGSAGTAATGSVSKTSTTPKKMPIDLDDWRKYVFKVMSKDMELELSDLQQYIRCNLPLNGYNERELNERIKEAVDYNVEHGRFREEDGRIRLATSKSSKTRDDSTNR